MPIYTAGHSNHSPDRLFEIIAPFRITHVIDIRSVPYSGRFPHFNRDNLQRLCTEHSIEYQWWGDSLGGKRGSDIGLDSIAEREDFKRAVKNLAGTFSGDRDDKVACLLCAERDPRMCHRSMLIGPALRALQGGVDLHHILPDGTLTCQSELEENQSAPKVDRAGTLSLFEDNER